MCIFSGSDVGSIWLRHSLENFKKCLKAIENKVAGKERISSDVPVVTLEKNKHDGEAFGGIKTTHIDYLCSQDRFYVGNLKYVVRIC